MRKPPVKVFSIVTQPTNDVITDADYARAVELQAMSLEARNAEMRFLRKLTDRLERGAFDGGRKWFFDRKLGIVRRRDKATG